MNEPPARPAPPVEAVLFDLDGTLADTLPELARSLNSVAKRFDGRPVSEVSLRAIVSRGGRAMAAAAFPDLLGTERFDVIHAAFLDAYAAGSGHPTGLFGGVFPAVSSLVALGCRWGIVTNKQARFTTPLVAALEFPVRPGCVVSGDTTHAPKPDPAPLRFACERLGVVPTAAVYIGDARTDVEAAHACGMRAIVARWGYLPEDDDPRGWGADDVVDRPEQIVEWVRAGRPAGPDR